MRKLILATRLTAIALLLFCGVALKAQVTTTANINGTVTDPSGAVVQGAIVTATNVNTNVQTQSTTDKDGLYNIRFLEIGTYTISFKAPGFGEQISKPFVLELAQDARRDAKLAPEGAAQQVTVQVALAPLLDTENATQATNLDARAIANIPLFGRTLTDLTQLQPGAISSSPSSVGNNISVNGSRYQGNNYSLDGMETNQNIDYGQTYQPNPDAVEQVQMVSATPTAEYGNVEGSTFLTVLKSGTNQFHGNAFFNLRNYLMDANTWGNKHTSGTISQRAPYTKYQMGGTLGGPIIKDRLFAFGDYQGYRYHQTTNTFTTVPTFDERGCSGGLPGSTCTGGPTADFSELLNPNVMCNEVGNGCSVGAGASRLIQLFNPFNNFAPYANNQGIPIANPVVKYLFAHNNLLPLPGSQLGINGVVKSTTGVSLTNGVNGNDDEPGYNNVATVTKAFTHSNQYDVKVDVKISSKDSASGSYSHYNTLGYTTPTLPINFPSESPNPINIIVFDEIHTFSPSVVNDFRGGFMRYVSLGAQTIDTSGVFGTNGDNILGIGSATGGTSQPFAGFAGQSTSVPGTLGGSLTTFRSGGEAMGGNANAGTNIVENTFLYSDTLTWLKDKHTFKFGVNIGRYQQNNFYPGNDGSMGSLNATGLFTADLLPSSDPRYPAAAKAAGNDYRGYAYADYVADELSATAIGGVSGFVGMRQYRDAYFAQDDWKIRPNLTLNLGFRYEYNTQINEVNNKYDAPDIVTQSVIIAGTPAANTYCPGCGTTLVHPFYGSALPRIGFNYAYTPRFVIRGGYSATALMEGTGANLRMTTNPPFQFAEESEAAIPTTTGNPGVPFTTEEGFNHAASGGTGTGLTYLLWSKNLRPAYVNTFSLGVEYQLNNTSSLSVAYVGKTGQHLVTAGGANQLPHACTDPSFVAAGNPAGFNENPGSTTTGPCLLSDPAPYQGIAAIGYTGQVKLTASNASENDNSLQAVFRQRLWHGLQYTFNFTWSHAMTDSTGFYSTAYAQDFYNNHAEYSPTIEDVRLASSWYLVYDLPFGRGREFFGNMNRVLDEVVGGWVVGMTGIEQTGLPQNVGGANAVNYRHGLGPQRPNQLRPLKVNGHSLTHWYGTDPSAVSATVCSGDNADGSGVDNGVCAFAQPALGTFGDAAYNALRGPGFQQYNASAQKNFTIYHEHAINFRADALNVLNQTELNDPNSNSPFGGTFGNITSAKSVQRQIQLTASYHF